MEMNSTMLPVPTIVMERSQSSKSDDPARKRVSNLTMKLKNAFRISSSVSTPSPSSTDNNNDNNNTNNNINPSGGLPLKTRSFSLPTNIHSSSIETNYQQQYYTLPPPPPLPLNELSNDPFHFERQSTIPILYDDNNKEINEINDHQYYYQQQQQQHNIMDIDHQQLLLNNETTILITDDDESKCIPSLIESTCSSTVSEDSNLFSTNLNHFQQHQQQQDDDHFEFEQHTQWVDTSKHWYSDIIPFYNKSSSNNNNNENTNNNNNNNNVLSTTSPNNSLQNSSSISSIAPTNEGILKTANKSILGKRPISSSSNISNQDNNDITSTSPTSSTSSSSSSSTSTSLSDNGNSGYNLIKGSLHKKKKKRVPTIRFDKMVQVHSTYSKNDYNRQSDPEAICTRLNAQLAFQIKQELNIFKNTEMPIHENSRIYTHFFY